MANDVMVPMRIKELKMDFVSSLVLEEEGGDRFLPVRLGGPSAKAMQLEMAGGRGVPTGIQDFLENALKYMNGTLIRVELRWEDRPGLLATMVIRQDGKEVRFPTRVADAMILARRYGAPIQVTELALTRTGVRATESGAQARGAEWMEAFRLTVGFKGMGRVDDAILACRRLRELAPGNDSWCTTLGELYREKGWLAAAARELFKGLAWYMREGYVTGAVEIGSDFGALDLESLPRVTLRAPATIEDFTSPECNVECWGAGEVVPAPDRGSERAYRLAAERDWCIWALLGTQTWEGRTVCLDVHFAPSNGKGSPEPLTFAVTLAGARAGLWSAPDVPLRAGWNKLSFPLSEPVWRRGEEPPVSLDDAAVGPVENIQVLFRKNRPAGDISFANIRLE